MAARPNQAELIAFNWLREVGKTKPKNISFWDNLARELVDASNNTVGFTHSGNCLLSDKDI